MTRSRESIAENTAKAGALSRDSDLRNRSTATSFVAPARTKQSLTIPRERTIRFLSSSVRIADGLILLSLISDFFAPKISLVRHGGNSLFDRDRRMGSLAARNESLGGPLSFPAGPPLPPVSVAVGGAREERRGRARPGEHPSQRLRCVVARVLSLSLSAAHPTRFLSVAPLISAQRLSHSPDAANDASALLSLPPLSAMFARSPPRTPHRTNKQQTREENDAVAPPAATIAAASASSFAAAAPSVPSAPGRLHVSLEIGRSPKSLVSCGERAFEAKLLEWLSRQRQGGSRVSSGTVPTQIEAGICRFSEGTIPPPAQLASDILSMRCEITREPEGDADLDSDDEDDAASVRKQEEDDAEFDLAEPSLVGLTQAASVSFAVYTLMDEEPQGQLVACA